MGGKEGKVSRADKLQVLLVWQNRLKHENTFEVLTDNYVLDQHKGRRLISERKQDRQPTN